MSLINFKSNRKTDAPVDISIEASSTPHVVQAMRPKGMEGLLNELKFISCLHFVSDGSWSMYELLMCLLEQFATPSKVYITTYSMTELSARIIAKLKDDKQIEELHLLMDYKSKMRYPNVDQLIRNACTSMGLAQLHAKVLIIKNGEHTLTIIGSANWTKNARIETGVIDKNTHVAESHIKWITQKIADGNK